MKYNNAYSPEIWKKKSTIFFLCIHFELMKKRSKWKMELYGLLYELKSLNRMLERCDR